VIRRRTPLKRGPAPARTRRTNPTRTKPRRGPMRNPEYLLFLRTECGCVACRAVDAFRAPGPAYCVSVVDAAHGSGVVIGAEWGGVIDPAHGPVNGRGSKGLDCEAISLCRFHHSEQHKIGWIEFEKKYGFYRAKEASAFYAAYLISTGKLG
jgi:hypothetical protein